MQHTSKYCVELCICAYVLDKCLIVYLNRLFSKDALYVCIPLNGHLLSTEIISDILLALRCVIIMTSILWCL